MNETTVVYHSADFDGIFCREIAKKFLPDAELIGWDFADAPLHIPEGDIYILDLPVDRVFGFKWDSDVHSHRFLGARQIVWIDHHKSSIDTHPKEIPGYRIDGVAACRLAWQWFSQEYLAPADKSLPLKPDYVDRLVSEPLAVRLAGEYDIWDKRDPNAELFQHGLRTIDLDEARWWVWFFEHTNDNCVNDLCERGQALSFARTQENASIIKAMGFDLEWEGLKFLACNHARYNSHLFAAGLRPDHDACFGFKYSKGKWEVSLYHAPGKEHHDLSQIAVKHGGGGHRGACGFQATKLPFIP